MTPISPAFGISCPECGAKPGKYCARRNELLGSDVVRTNSFHKSRYHKAYSDPKSQAKAINILRQKKEDKAKRLSARTERVKLRRLEQMRRLRKLSELEKLANTDVKDAISYIYNRIFE